MAAQKVVHAILKDGDRYELLKNVRNVPSFRDSYDAWELQESVDLSHPTTLPFDVVRFFMAGVDVRTWDAALRFLFNDGMHSIGDRPMLQQAGFSPDPRLAVDAQRSADESTPIPRMISWRLDGWHLPLCKPSWHTLELCNARAVPSNLPPTPRGIHSVVNGLMFACVTKSGVVSMLEGIPEVCGLRTAALEITFPPLPSHWGWRDDALDVIAEKVVFHDRVRGISFETSLRTNNIMARAGRLWPSRTNSCWDPHAAWHAIVPLVVPNALNDVGVERLLAGCAISVVGLAKVDQLAVSMHAAAPPLKAAIFEHSFAYSISYEHVIGHNAAACSAGCPARREPVHSLGMEQVCKILVPGTVSTIPMQRVHSLKPMTGLVVDFRPADDDGAMTCHPILQREFVDRLTVIVGGSTWLATYSPEAMGEWNWLRCGKRKPLWSSARRSYLVPFSSDAFDTKTFPYAVITAGETVASSPRSMELKIDLASCPRRDLVCEVFALCVNEAIPPPA